VEPSPVTDSNPFLQATTRSTLSRPGRITTSLIRGRDQGIPPTLPVRGGRWRTAPAESADSRSLPAWPLRDGPFFRYFRWDRPGCIPPLIGAEFVQEVLYECGLAQVGFGAIYLVLFIYLLSKRLTLSLLTLTKFEPLRLTHPWRGSVFI